MLAAVLLSLFLSIPSPTTDSRITGVWVLNQQKSDWGETEAPDEVLLRIEQSDRSLAVWEISTTPTGRHIAYRQLLFDDTKCIGGSSRIVRHSGCGISARSPVDEERWGLSDSGELVVNREVRQGLHLVHQRLVLEHSVEFGE
jgi:hypothetical protein